MSTFTEADQQAVEQAEHAIAAAHLDLDRGIDVIAHLLHPDYVLIQPGGDIETKDDVLASYRSGTRRWDTAAVDQLSTRAHGDAAIVIGRWRATGQNGAAHFDYQARFLSVWVRHDGTWRNIAYQSTEIGG
ncbi:nuclear transport factor 2 family protein [Burkholderia stabilis]|uniref:nuclear transport factor 2 family protein n=1 Tax=Burkholderia stabilis TaxID=95485 RepID=UPI001F4A92C5|nr:nuclear transport factor 2 family protein [Burkholderia stabilis]